MCLLVTWVFFNLCYHEEFQHHRLLLMVVRISFLQLSWEVQQLGNNGCNKFDASGCQSIAYWVAPGDIFAAGCCPRKLIDQVAITGNLKKLRDSYCRVPKRIVWGHCHFRRGIAVLQRVATRDAFAGRWCPRKLFSIYLQQKGAKMIVWRHHHCRAPKWLLRDVVSARGYWNIFDGIH